MVLVLTYKILGEFIFLIILILLHLLLNLQLLVHGCVQNGKLAIIKKQYCMQLHKNKGRLIAALYSFIKSIILLISCGVNRSSSSSSKDSGSIFREIFCVSMS